MFGHGTLPYQGLKIPFADDGTSTAGLFRVSEETSELPHPVYGARKDHSNAGKDAIRFLASIINIIKTVDPRFYAVFHPLSSITCLHFDIIFVCLSNPPSITR